MGPSGRKRCHATSLARDRVTVPTAAFCPYDHPGARKPAKARTREFAPSAPTTTRAWMSVVAVSDVVSFASPTRLSVTTEKGPGRVGPQRTPSTPLGAAATTPSLFAASASAACTIRFSTTYPRASAPSSLASYRTCPGARASQTCIAVNGRARAAATRSQAPTLRSSATDAGVSALTRASATAGGASSNEGGGGAARSTKVTERCFVRGDARSRHAIAVPTTPPPTTHTSTTSGPEASDDANPRASAEIGGRVPGASPRVAAIARATRRAGSMAPPTRARAALGWYARGEM
jgi:hypothetical protein